MNVSKTWYEICHLESVDLCGYVKDISYHPQRMNAPYWVLALMESGQRTLKVNGSPLKVKRGSYKILPPGSLQEPIELDHQSAYYIHFRASGGVVGAPRRIDSEKLLLPIYDHFTYNPDCIALAQYMCEQSLKPYVCQDFLKCQLQALLSILSLQTQCNMQMANTSLHTERILSFIEANMCVALKAADYEKEFGLSYHQLNVVFKQKFGYTIKQYHHKIRMRHAANFLLSGKTARETAELCGYEDYYFFIRSFTKAYGISPGRYQKQR